MKIIVFVAGGSVIKISSSNKDVEVFIADKDNADVDKREKIRYDKLVELAKDMIGVY